VGKRTAVPGMPSEVRQKFGGFAKPLARPISFHVPRDATRSSSWATRRDTLAGSPTYLSLVPAAPAIGIALLWLESLPSQAERFLRLIADVAAEWERRVITWRGYAQPGLHSASRSCSSGMFMSAQRATWPVSTSPFSPSGSETTGPAFPGCAALQAVVPLSPALSATAPAAVVGTTDD